MVDEVEKITPAKPVKDAAEKTVRTAKLAAAPKPETVEAFTMAPAEMPEVFRDMAEKSVKQAKEHYEKMRAAAEEATDMLEDQFETARNGFVELNAKAIEAAKANADATFRFAKDVLAVKSVAEIIELQTAFARQQFDLVSAQAKEMQDLLTKYTTETQQPVKEAFTKIFKDVRAA
ncbi:phasin [Chthonobacter rhizosphaerae]|uniref:phasin n=1 Tax=Chthonobacter rhizosphaerae TaxID=2735553 RepID=UPI0015EF8458|nr:phasin [Chthonobacter rhizosphaerae]